jgi:hypothetical protein
MPDALQQAAQQLAPPPARTNFFDPAAGQTVISRYANVKRAGEGLEALGKATTGLADAQLRMEDQQLQREAAMRNKTIFDRESQTYQEQQDFKTERGNFLSQIGGLDPMSPDFQTSVAELISGVPEVAMRDDAVQAILAAKNRAWENAQREKEREDYRRQVIEERDKDYEDRVMVGAAQAGLKPEDLAKFKKADGRYDIFGIAFESGRRERELKPAKKEDYSAEIEKRAKQALADQAAFPSQESLFIQQYGAEANGSPNKAKNPAAYQAAKEYDSDRFSSELESARSMEEDEYVGKVPGLSPKLQAKRKALWKVANEGSEAPAAQAPAPAQRVRRYNPATGKIE